MELTKQELITLNTSKRKYPEWDLKEQFIQKLKIK